MHFDDRALGRNRVSRRGFVLGPGGVCHQARIRHGAWLMCEFTGTARIFVGKTTVSSKAPIRKKNLVAHQRPLPAARREAAERYRPQMTPKTDSKSAD